MLGLRSVESLTRWAKAHFQKRQYDGGLKLRKGAEWYVTPPKTEKSIRTISLTPALVKGLEDQRKRQLEMRLKAGANWKDAGFIFADEAGGPLKFPAVRKLHKRICADAELPSTWKLKASRHSCASALLKKGVSLKVIGDRLGHSSLAVTADIYAVVAEELVLPHVEREG
jgi:integrase